MCLCDLKNKESKPIGLCSEDGMYVFCEAETEVLNII
jgi:hypothetical protein